MPGVFASGAPVAAASGRMRRPVVVAMALTVLLGVLTAAPGASAAEPTEDERALAERFAPVIRVKEQDEPCDTNGEPFVPTSVEIVLDNPEVALRQVSRGDPVVMRAPGASDLVGLGEGFYLDFPGNSLTPECVYERDFRKYHADAAPTVYAHIVQPPGEPGVLYVQYWFYWYYNDWNNKHESDWEGITLRFESASIADALASEPVAVGYSQHEGGERAGWDADKLDRVGDHPVVYSSARSHASYFGSALYLGRAANEGFGCDDTSGPSQELRPEVVVLPDAVDDPDDPLAWLGYRGRWGERQNGAFNGPTGPAAKDRWLDPTPWFDDLRGSSVVIPAGDSAAASVIRVFCGTVEAGSRALIGFTTSPERMVVALVLVGLLARFLVRRTEWDAVAPTPVVHRRRAGQIVRAALTVYRRDPLVFVAFGLIYIPAAIVTGALSALIELVPLVGSLVSLSDGGGTSIVVAALVGSLANVAAFVVVNAMVTDYLGTAGRGVGAAAEAARTGWRRRGDLAGAFGRSYAIVFLLLSTVVLAPFGIRQLVRYQFAPQAVMAEERRGGAALRRSSALVRGRWWHTAVVVATINGAIALTALAAALLLLVAASGVPLWIFSGLVSVVYALVVPLAAIAVTLLYGDAVAEREETEANEPVPAG